MKNRKFPGKLYLMGEYFVTQPGGEAVVIAVDRFISTYSFKADIFKLSSDYGSICGEVPSSPKMEVALEAKTIAYDYLNENKYLTHDVNLEVDSDLLVGGVKIGLGSSAVIIVAVIQSILESHNVYLDKLKLFKLSVLCQKRLGDLSSGGDLAASIYSGIIYYKRYDEEILETKESFKVLDKVWPNLRIKNLEIPKDYRLLIGWTQKSNSTDNYLKVFNKKIVEDPKTYAKFSKRAHGYVKMFVDEEYESAVSNYRQLMLELEQWTKLDIETVELKSAIELSLQYGASSKISGSGGGDCMFALTNKQIPEIISAWTKNNIRYLDIGVWNNDSITKKR